MDNKKKMDKRVKYTKYVLQEALIDMLETQHINKITVKQLCDAADVNRSTFYAHYQDQFDLLRQIELEVYTEIQQYINNKELAGQAPITVPTLQKVLFFIAENAALCKVLLGDNGNRGLLQDLMQLAQEKTLEEMEIANTDDKRLSDYLQLFIITGCLSVLQKWLEDDMVESPQEMAELVYTLISSGTSKFFTGHA